MKKLLFAIPAALLVYLAVPVMTTPAEAATCSSEKRACHARCRTSYGHTGDPLKYCQMVSCGKAFQRCMATGEWLISRTGERKSLQRK